MKFYRRSATEETLADIKLEDTKIFYKRVAFIRSNMDETTNKVRESELASQEFLRIDVGGQMGVFVMDPYRAGKWCMDAARSDVNWQCSTIVACSKIRAGLFATINYLGARSFIVFWRLDKLEVAEVEDRISDAKAVILYLTISQF